jgi:tripartite ATP-independent transporter DctP family solute receptor
MDRRKVLGMMVAAPFVVGTKARAAEVNLRLASFATDASSWGRAQETLKAELAKRSGGRIELSVFNNNTLGSNREALELARRGGVDMVLTGVSHATRNVPQLNALVFPYLFKDRASMFQALDGQPGTKLDALMKEQGLGALAWWDNGFRHVSNNRRPIVEPGDLQGLKLRTLPTGIHVSFFRKIGAVPTPMDFAELLPALRQGVIDGQENPPAVMGPFKIFEVQKFYSLTAHVNEPMVLVMSEQSRKKVPANLQNVLTEAAAAASAFQREVNAKEEEQIMAELRKSMQVNEPPAKTMASLREVARTVYGEAFSTLGPGGEEIVADIARANS